jgi:quercetin dioxygenase-like cupin family protein
LIHYFKPPLEELPRVVDPRYVGPSLSRFRAIYESSDRVLEVGLWDFTGEHTTPIHEGYEEVLIVLSGVLTISCAGETFVVSAGEILVYDCPIPPQRITAAGGATAAYVIRHRAQ